MANAGHRHLRRGGPELEDASILQLGEGKETVGNHSRLLTLAHFFLSVHLEFENSQCLYISEVRILLEAQSEAKETRSTSK